MIPYMAVELETIIKQEQVDRLVGDYIGFLVRSGAAESGFGIFVTVSGIVGSDADALPVFLPTANNLPLSML